MLRPGHIPRPRDLVAEAARAAAYERKQRWKEQPGNRYTPEELREMSASFGPFTVHRPKRRVIIMD